MRHFRFNFVIAVLIVCLAGCDFGPGVQASITAGQKHFQSVLDALAKYHRNHNEYPVKLDDLAGESLLTEVPKTPVVGNAMDGGPYYRVSEDHQSCEFQFSYHLKHQGMGLGDTTYAQWNSKTGKWSMTGPGY